MNSDQIAERFSLNEACDLAECDKCGEKFDITRGVYQLEKHWEDHHA